jgi:hypothetical protein
MSEPIRWHKFFGHSFRFHKGVLVSPSRTKEAQGNDGAEASRPCKPDDGDNQIKEKDDHIAHPAMEVSKHEKTPNFGPIQ